MAIRDIFKFLKFFSANEKNYKGEPAWGDCNQVNGLLLKLIDEIRAEAGVPILIHAAFENTGHASNSEHKRGDALDFHFKNISLWKGYSAIQKVLARYNLQNRVGIGVYFWWANPGFHLDLRGFALTWYSLSANNYVYDKAKTELLMQQKEKSK